MHVQKIERSWNELGLPSTFEAETVSSLGEDD